MSGFNKFLLAVLLACGGYNAWGAFHQKLFPLQPLYQKPYIVVYGRDDCAFCQALKADLDARKIPYVWKNINDGPARAEIAPRMKQADIDTGHFLLPVVDVNAEIMTRPDPAVVAAKYRL